MSSTPIMRSGPSVWVALHNSWIELFLLNARHRVGTVEVEELVEPPGDAAGARPSSLGDLVLSYLSPVQQHQLTQLLEAYGDVFGQDEDDIGQTTVLKHTIETQGPLYGFLTADRTQLCSGRNLNRSSKFRKVALFVPLTVRGHHWSSW